MNGRDRTAVAGDASDSYDRRSVLRGVAAAGAFAAAPAAVRATGEGAPPDEVAACVSPDPLSYRDATVESFYGYARDDRSRADTPTDVERASVSRLFLYRGPKGLSLVVIHGGGDEDELGGAASMTFSGLPDGGEWVVLDEEGTDDLRRFDDAVAIHWAWGPNRTDGAAFRGLGEDFAVTVTPAFDRAARREPLGPGEVETWQLLSGSATDPEVRELPLDRPVVVSDDCGDDA